MTTSRSRRKRRAKQGMVNIVRKFYVGAFNIYSIYWLYKIIAYQPANWETVEDLLLWFFATVGVFMFILDNRSKLEMNDYYRGVD